MKQDITIHEAEQLVERYFDGATTLEEEARLRRLLSQTQLQSETINEARAVMGYFAAIRKTGHPEQIAPKHRPALHPWRPAAMKAASAVAIAIVTLTVIKSAMPADHDCIAYIGGQSIGDRTHVLQLVSDDLRSVAEASESVNDGIREDIRNISDAFNMNI